MVHMIAIEVLPEERDRKYYADNYTCCPPPVFMIVISLLELGFFVYHAVVNGGAEVAGPVPIDSPLIYRPDKRHEFWRFATYMVIHAGWLHLCFNLAVQLAVGLPLEMVHGSLRAGAVYAAGVVAGSLGSSVFDREVCLAGASGGVYALLAAHLSNVMLNFHAMQYGLLRLLCVFFIASCDVGFAIYSRYAVDAESWGVPVSMSGVRGASDGDPMPPPVSYVAHLTGALAGLTIGLLVLKNFQQRLVERLLWWAALGVYAACTLFAVLYNIYGIPGEEDMPDTRVQVGRDVIRQQKAYFGFGF